MLKFKVISLSLIVLTLSACGLTPSIKTIPKQEVTQKYTYEFNSSHKDVVNATTDAVSKLGWTNRMVSETSESSSSDDLFLFALGGIHI